MTNNPYSEPQSSTVASKPINRLLLALIGLVTVVLAGLLLLVFLLMPFSRGPMTRQAARRTQCKNNLKQIGLALHNYHDKHDAFPPAYTVDETGKRLHSWRTLILPYMDQAALFETIDLSKPWDDPVNQQALETNIHTYACPSAGMSTGHTTYLAITGPGYLFDGSEPKRIRDVKDGTSNTLMVIEVAQDQAIHWMSPNDADSQLLSSIGPDSDFAHEGGFQAALVDGSVRFLSSSLPSETLRALTTIAGNETVGEY